MKNYNVLKAFDPSDKLIWKDPKGIIHECEKTLMHRDVLLIWTKCQLEPPHDLVRRDSNKITCEKCLPTGKGESE